MSNDKNQSKLDMNGTAVLEEIETSGSIYMPMVFNLNDLSPGKTRFLKFDPTGLLKKLEEGKNAEVCEELIEIFKYFESYQVENADGQYLEMVNMMAKVIMKIFATKSFTIPINEAPKMLFLNSFISNLVRMSVFKNTDLVLKLLLQEDFDILKIMILYGSRNTIVIDEKIFFQHDRFLATVWWATVIDGTSNCNTQNIYNNMMRFFNLPSIHNDYTIFNQRFSFVDSLTHPYFWTSYYDPEQEPILKPIINKEVRKYIENPPISANPNFKKILLVSWFFRKGHAVYKCMAPLLYSLKGHYHITQIVLDGTMDSNDPNVFDMNLVDEIHRINLPNSKELNPKIEEIIKSGEYGILFLPDVGMNFASIVYANRRIAPIQIATYGHPVSGWGTEVDYFIGGVESELPENPERNYSERLVLIPGLGIEAVCPEYTKQEPIRAPDHQNKILISCSWGAVKFNYKHLLNLKKIAESSSKDIAFMFSGIKATRFHLLPFINDLYEVLSPEQIIMCGYEKYDAYVGRIEYCDFGIDAYPFGSYNRIVDTFLAGRPLVAYEGQRAYNRFAAATLRRLGRDRLIATNDTEFVDITLRMIEDDDFRKEETDFIQNVNFAEIISDRNNHKYYKKAFDYLVENHEKLKADGTKNPIYIEKE